MVIEEFLDGPEVSVFALADGATAIPLLPAQDFKRAYDGDSGPNTGGMGAYAPLLWAPPGLTEEVMSQVVEPALAELNRRGTPYSGLLYTGLSLTSRGPRVVEFNARFGDPETQVVLDRLATPLGGLLRAAAHRRPGGRGPRPVAAGRRGDGGNRRRGLPRKARQRGRDPRPGRRRGPARRVRAARRDDDRDDGTLVSSGGRVLNVVGTGDDVAQARGSAYAAAAMIKMRGGWYRTDIAAAGSERRPTVTGPDGEAGPTARPGRTGRRARCGSARWSCSSTWSSPSR